MTAPPRSGSQTLQCLQVWGGNQALDTAVAMPGLEAYVYSRPHEGGDGGGDVYYVSSCATGRIARVLLADVSGHGLRAADMAARLRDLMRRHMNYLNQSSFVATLNSEFSSLSGEGVFATAVVVSCWLPSHEMVICNAGHPRVLVRRARTGRWSILDPSELARGRGGGGSVPANLPLGVVDPARYDQVRVRFEPGDLVLLYTDSVTEARARGGSFLGEGGLLDLLNGLGPIDPGVLVPTLVRALEEHRKGDEPDDDLSIVLLRHTGTRHARSLAGAFSHAGRAALRLRDALRGDRVGGIRTLGPA